MNRRIVLARIATSVIVAGAGIARVRGNTAQTTRALKDVVADAERAFADSMAKRDLAAFSAHVSQEAIFFGGADGSTPMRGRPAIVDAWKRYFDGPAAPFSWAPDSAEVLDSGTLAATSGPIKDPKGQITGRFSSIWRIEGDGRWRVVFDRGCQVCR